MLKNKIPYRLDIDGLRALAVLLVIFFHAKIYLFSGGYVGVDIFFVISGFIITTIIINEIENKEFSYLNFYAKRAKRLVPPLYIMVFFTLIFVILYFLPNKFQDTNHNIGYLSIFLSNIYLSKKIGYFSPAADELPFLHTWSLSIEEQFYLIFPPLIIILLKLGKKITFSVLIIIFFISLFISQFNLYQENQNSFYFIQDRAYEFLIGVTLAVFEFNKNGDNKNIYFDFLLGFGIVIIIISAFYFNTTTPFPGLFALLPCFGTALIIFSGKRSVKIHKVLSNKFLVYIGRISYCLYLWHWPVFFALHRLGLNSNTWIIYGITISFVLSWLTHNLIEKPIRDMDIKPLKSIALFVILPIIFSAILIIIGKLSNHFLFIYPKDFVELYKKSKMTIWSNKRATQCWNLTKISNPEICSLGNLSSKRKAFLWGDSHAYHLIDFVDTIGKEYNLSIHDSAYSACPPLIDMPEKSADKSLAKHNLICKKRNKEIEDYLINQHDVDTVLLAASWDSYMKKFPYSSFNRYGFTSLSFESIFYQTVSTLVKNKKNVVLLEDIPALPYQYINCDLYNKLPFLAIKSCIYNSVDAGNIEGKRTMDTLFNNIKKQYPQVKIIHIYDVLCNNNICKTSFNGVPIYRQDDLSHLNEDIVNLLYYEYKKKHPEELNILFGQ